MATSEIKLVISAKDEASKVLRKTSGEVNKMNKNLAETKRTAKIALAAIGALSLKIGKDAVVAAATFSKSMANVSTLVDTSAESMDDMKKQVLALSTKLPVALADLSSALYDIRSAGISAEMAMGTLESSARLATAGLGTTKEAATLVTLSLNNFRDAGYTADEVSNLLFKTVKGGITTIGELSQSFGLVAPLAVNAGISLEELQAATSALTQVNKNASISQNEIKAALVSMSKPTAELNELLGELSVKTFKELVASSGGMVEAFGKLEEAAGGNEEKFAKALGSAEGYTAVLALLGSQSDSYTEILADMESGTDDVTEAFEKQNDEAFAQYEILKNKLNVEMIRLGTKILPLLTRNVHLFIDGLEGAKQGEVDLLGVSKDLIKYMTGNWMKGMEQTWKMVKKITSSIYDSISAVVKWIEKLKDAREAKEKSGSGRQFGGSVGQGQATVVGEHRPEVFIPSQSGNIRQLDQSTGTGKEVNINFNNVNVRNDSDLDDIVSAVKRELSRDQELNAIGAR